MNDFAGPHRLDPNVEDQAFTTFGSVLTIDLEALVANWRQLAFRAAPADCGAVVKADAYGCGIEAVVPALARAGCTTFFVAHVGEGVRARQAAPDATIYVLNGLLPEAAATYAQFALRPVLGSRAEITDWAEFCRENVRRPAAIHVDTGMNRLGLSPDDARLLANDPLLQAFQPSLVMSHFVAAEDADDPVTKEQIALFAELSALFPTVPTSLSNSSGHHLTPGIAQTLTRPGYALFGGNPTPGASNPMRPVITLEARIIQVRDVASGSRAGYNGRWIAAGPRRLATLSIGYADGYPRNATGHGVALVGDVLCPLAGTVSMDLIILDVTDAPADCVQRGAPVTMIGGILDVDEVGRRAGTIGYEILTRLGSRYARRYLGA